jgi:DNA polymerase-3 subunit delta'
MALGPIIGHTELLSRFGASIAAGRFPQSVLLTGPQGVGKQRVALWAAQALLCEGAEPPCGLCMGCRQVLALSHPDLHWFVPVARLKATEPDKQVAEVEEALAEIMTQRRTDGRWSAPEGAVSHPLASIRLLQRRVALTPFRGRRKVVVLGDADRLVVQEASQEAANALLKVLEEPPADTTLILTTAEPQALLPTVRSRAVPVRFAPLTDEAARQREAEEPAATPSGDQDREVDALLAAMKQGPAIWAARALRQAPWDARGGYTGLLDALSVRAHGGLKDRATKGDRAGAGRLAKIVRRVETARGEAQGNRNPQLGLAVLLRDMEKLS